MIDWTPYCTKVVTDIPGRPVAKRQLLAGVKEGAIDLLKIAGRKRAPGHQDRGKACAGERTAVAA